MSIMAFPELTSPFLSAPLKRPTREVRCVFSDNAVRIKSQNRDAEDPVEWMGAKREERTEADGNASL